MSKFTAVAGDTRQAPWIFRPFAMALVVVTLGLLVVIGSIAGYARHSDVEELAAANAMIRANQGAKSLREGLGMLLDKDTDVRETLLVGGYGLTLAQAIANSGVDPSPYIVTKGKLTGRELDALLGAIFVETQPAADAMVAGKVAAERLRLDSALSPR